MHKATCIDYPRCWGVELLLIRNSKRVHIICEEIVSTLGNKGLYVGEMDNDQLEYFLVNPKTRNLTQVEFPSNVDEFNRIMGTSIGKHDLFKRLNILVDC